jgi:hypothetical protein
MVILRNYGWCLRDKSFRLKYNISEINKIILKSFLSSSFYSLSDKIYFNSLFYYLVNLIQLVFVGIVVYFLIQVMLYFVDLNYHVILVKGLRQMDIY